MTALLCASLLTIASWYGEESDLFTASGERFNPAALTAASWDYPFGARLQVSHGAKTVVVRVNDRGPAKRFYHAGRKLDLSRAAFEKLAPLERGLIRVKVLEVE